MAIAAPARGASLALADAPAQAASPHTLTLYSAQHGQLVKLLVADFQKMSGATVQGITSGGLGWFIYENKNELNIPSVFAGLLTVILIGLFVENFIFRIIARNTIQKWGMQG